MQQGRIIVSHRERTKLERKGARPESAVRFDAMFYRYKTKPLPASSGKGFWENVSGSSQLFFRRRRRTPAKLTSPVPARTKVPGSGTSVICPDVIPPPCSLNATSIWRDTKLPPGRKGIPKAANIGALREFVVTSPDRVQALLRLNGVGFVKEVTPLKKPENNVAPGATTPPSPAAFAVTETPPPGLKVNCPVAFEP